MSPRDPVAELQDWMRIFSPRRKWADRRVVNVPARLYDTWRDIPAMTQELYYRTGEKVKIVRQE